MTLFFIYSGNTTPKYDNYFSEGLKPPTSIVMYTDVLPNCGDASMLEHEVRHMIIPARPKARSLRIGRYGTSDFPSRVPLQVRAMKSSNFLADIAEDSHLLLHAGAQKAQKYKPRHVAATQC